MTDLLKPRIVSEVIEGVSSRDFLAPHVDVDTLPPSLRDARLRAFERLNGLKHGEDGNLEATLLAAFIELEILATQGTAAFWAGQVTRIVDRLIGFEAIAVDAHQARQMADSTGERHHKEILDVLRRCTPRE